MQELHIRAISLWQPWATLMASGAKKIETRSWKPFIRPHELIAIHAAKRWTKDEYDLCFDDPFYRRHLQLAERRGLWNFTNPPRGCIVAVATFKAAYRTEELQRRITDTERAFGDYGPARYGWEFIDACPLPVPIPYRGQQGIFQVYLDGEFVRRAIVAQRATNQQP